MKNAHTYRLPVVIEKDASGYFASCPALQGCYSQGDTYEEAVAHIEDAMRLHLEDRLAEDGELAEPGELILSSIEVALQS